MNASWPKAARRESSTSLAWGACFGVLATALVTWLRSRTWVPYEPVMLPYDAFVITGASAIAFSAAGIAKRVLRNATAGLHVIAVCCLSWILLHEALVEIEKSRMVVWSDSILWLGTLAMCWFRPRAPHRAYLPFVACVAASLLGLAVSLYTQTPSGIQELTAPALLLVVACLGVRPPPAAASRPALVAALVLSATLGTVYAPQTLSRPAVAADAGKRGPSVVLIVLDNLRRDRLSLYGYSRKTTPQLDAWARGAEVFDHAVSTSGWTLPAHASMFTGLFPRSHGAHGYPSELKINSTYPLRKDVQTLAEVARDAGVRTGAVVANHHYLGPEFGVDQGFEDYQLLRPRPGLRLGWLDRAVLEHDRYRYTAIDWPYMRAPFVTDRAMRWLARHGGEPHFLFVNYMDVHRPNDRPGNAVVPWQDEMVVPGYFPELTKVLEHQKLDPKVTRSLINSYDRELIELDGQVMRLIHFIEASVSGRDTLIVVTSDHGEYFGEHDLINHMMHVYAEETNVPMLLKGPGVNAGRSTLPVQVTDVYNTVLEALGVEVPPQSQAQSLLRAVPRPQVAEWYSAANGFLRDPQYKGRFTHDVIGYQDGPLRLILYASGRAELYDVSRDVYETHDIADERPEAVARLRAAVLDWQASHPPPAQPPG